MRCISDSLCTKSSPASKKASSIGYVTWDVLLRVISSISDIESISGDRTSEDWLTLIDKTAEIWKNRESSHGAPSLTGRSSA